MIARSKAVIIRAGTVFLWAPTKLHVHDDDVTPGAFSRTIKHPDLKLVSFEKLQLKDRDAGGAGVEDGLGAPGSELDGFSVLEHVTDEDAVPRGNGRQLVT